MFGDCNGLPEVSGVDDEDEDDEVGDGKAIGKNVEDVNEGIDATVGTVGSSIITSRVSEIFSKVTSLCLDFCALEPLPERLNSFCKSCICCSKPSFSLYCSSVPDLKISQGTIKTFDKSLYNHDYVHVSTEQKTKSDFMTQTLFFVGLFSVTKPVYTLELKMK